MYLPYWWLKMNIIIFRDKNILNLGDRGHYASTAPPMGLRRVRSRHHTPRVPRFDHPGYRRSTTHSCFWTIIRANCVWRVDWHHALHAWCNCGDPLSSVFFCFSDLRGVHTAYTTSSYVVVRSVNAPLVSVGIQRGNACSVRFAWTLVLKAAVTISFVCVSILYTVSLSDMNRFQ